MYFNAFLRLLPLIADEIFSLSDVSDVINTEHVYWMGSVCARVSVRAFVFVYAWQSRKFTSADQRIRGTVCACVCMNMCMQPNENFHSIYFYCFERHGLQSVENFQVIRIAVEAKGENSDE